MISEKFIKSSFIYSIVGSLPLLTSVILLPFYTNLLTTDQFGMLALYIALTAVLQIFVNFAIDHYIAVNWVNFKDDKQQTKDQIGTAVSSLLIIAVAFVIIYLIAGFFAIKIFPDLNNIKVFEIFPWGFMCLLTAIGNSAFKTYAALLIYQERPVRFFWISLVNVALTLGISLAFLYSYPYTLMGPMWGRLLSGVGIFFLAYFFFLKEYGITFRSKLIKEIAIFSYPLMLYLALLWIVGNADRYIIAYFLTASDIAIFDFAIKCTMIIEVLQTGLTSTIYPKIFKIWKEQNINHSTLEANRYFNGLTGLSMLLIPVLIIVLPLLVPMIVTNPDYYKSFSFIGILFSGFAFTALKSYFTAPLMYYKKTKALPKVYFYSAIIQLILTVILVKYFDISGAVWAFVIVRIIQVIFLYNESRKVFTFKLNLFKQIMLPSLFIILVIISELTMAEQYRMFYHIVQFIIIGGLVMWVYRKEFKDMIQSYKEKLFKRSESKIE